MGDTGERGVGGGPVYGPIPGAAAVTSERAAVPVLARASAICGASLLFYPVAAAIMAVGNHAWWHHRGHIDGQVWVALPALVVGLALCAWPASRLRRGRRTWQPTRPGHPGRLLALVVGLLGLVWALDIVVQTLWFEMTYIDAGHVGASFWMIGSVLAYVVAPVAALLTAYGLDALPARTGGDRRRTA